MTRGSNLVRCRWIALDRLHACRRASIGIADHCVQHPPAGTSSRGVVSSSPFRSLCGATSHLIEQLRRLSAALAAGVIVFLSRGEIAVAHLLLKYERRDTGIG